jgi:N-acetylmuramoyl-L-alanine amidase
MEMMRQAAAKAAPPAPPPSPDSPPRPAPPIARAASATSAPARPAESEQRRQAALEEERIRRIKKRRIKRRQRTVGTIGGVFRTWIVVLIAAGLVATIVAWWTPTQFLSDNVQRELGGNLGGPTALPAATLPPTPVVTPNWLRRIGIVSGHRGPQIPPDPGAVCPDGLTEAEINFAVAQGVVAELRARGYQADLLDEFDPRLESYQAAALVSIHANTCRNFGELVSGFIVARAAARLTNGPDDVLVDCLARYYFSATQLARSDRPPTRDMTDYHSFREIHPLTPAAIIELGFMLADRPVLTGKQPEMAQGIVNGILCFLEPGTPPPTAPPPVTSG